MRMNMMRIPCANLEQASNFYSEKIGLERVFGSEEEGFIGYQLENIQLLLELEEENEFESGRFLGFSLEVKDIELFYNESLELGLKFTHPPEKQNWGGTMTHVIDCSGNTFSMVQNDRGA